MLNSSRMWRRQRTGAFAGKLALRAVLVCAAALSMTWHCGCTTPEKPRSTEEMMAPNFSGMYGEPQRTYQVVRAKGEVKIDGKPDEPAWGDAGVIRDMVLAHTQEKPAQNTEVRLLWDEEFLYVSFVCYDRFIYNTYTQPDDPIYANQDCVEVFLNPDMDPRLYYELNVSPANVTWTGISYRPRFPDRPHHIFTAFNPRRFSTATHVEGEMNAADQASRLWSAEYAIPFDCLSTAPHRPPEVGDRWRINLYRIDLVEKGEPKDRVEFISWSPPGIINFHMPHKFGEIIFVE